MLWFLVRDWMKVWKAGWQSGVKNQEQPLAFETR